MESVFKSDNKVDASRQARVNQLLVTSLASGFSESETDTFIQEFMASSEY